MKKNYWRYIVTGLMALGFYYYLQIDKKATVLLEDSEYPILNNNSLDYNGVIANRTISGVYRGVYLFDLTNGQKFSTSGFSFLKIGDSIHRPANMDIIFLFIDGKLDSIPLHRR